MKRRFRNILSFSVLVCLLSCNVLDDLQKSGRYSLNAEKALHDLCACNGRREGTKGNLQARDFLMSEIQKMGWNPSLQYFQNINNQSISNILVPVSNGHDELIIAGAHYDGAANNKFFPAANDNASGCITMLLILDSLKNASIDKDVLICFWNGEEGIVKPTLKGSGYFVENLENAERIKYYINCDVVGFSHDNDYTNVFYSDADVYDHISGKTNTDGLDVHFTSMSEYLQNSDNVSFYRAGIPTIAINDGSYPWLNYPIHSSKDTPESISIERLKKMRNLVISMMQ